MNPTFYVAWAELSSDQHDWILAVIDLMTGADVQDVIELFQETVLKVNRRRVSQLRQLLKWSGPQQRVRIARVRWAMYLCLRDARPTSPAPKVGVKRGRVGAGGPVIT